MSSDESAAIKLRVTEALAKDMGRALARMDPEDLQRLGLGIGEIVEIRGKRTTVCKAMPAYKEQRGQSRIQIDGISRENVGVLDAPFLGVWTRSSEEPRRLMLPEIDEPALTVTAHTED